MKDETTFGPTLIGCGAVLMWSVYAVVVSGLSQLPLFEILTFVFGISFIAMSIRLTLKKQWYLVKQPIWIWLIGSVGLCSTDWAYVAAFQYAPPAHIDLIDYMWPFIVILLSGLVSAKERCSIKDVIGGSLGVVGLYVLLTGGQGRLGFCFDYLPGYLFALLGALIWSSYTLFSRRFSNIPIEMVGMYCGVGMVAALLGHLRFESFVIPTWSEFGLLSILGSAGAAYLLWDYGAKRGNLKLLGLLTYFTPILSMTLLVCFGKQQMNASLLYACSLVFGGIVVSTVDWRECRQWLASWVLRPA